MTFHRATDAHSISVTVVRSLYRSWWVATALLLIVGTVARFDLVTKEDLGPLGRTAEIAAADSGAASALPDDFEGFPTIRYAGFDVALLGSRAIPDNNSGRPIVVTELAVRNSTDLTARLPGRSVSLMGPDGVTASLDRFEYSRFESRLVLEPGETQQALAVFKLRGSLGPDLSDFAVQIAELGRWPESLPLSGPVPAPVYPLAMEPTGGFGSEVGAAGFTVQLLAAETALDYGLYRVPIGQHLAVVTVSLSGAPGAVDRGALSRDHWLLDDGNEQHRAMRVQAIERSVDGTAATAELVFAFSTEASQLELLVGRDGQLTEVAGFAVQAFE